MSKPPPINTKRQKAARVISSPAIHYQPTMIVTLPLHGETEKEAQRRHSWKTWIQSDFYHSNQNAILK